MNIYNSLYHNTLLRKMEKVRDEHTRITNILFGKVIGDQVKFCVDFAGRLEYILGDNNEYHTEAGGNYIRVYSKHKFAYPEYGYKREIASINLKDGEIRFKRKGIEGRNFIRGRENFPYSQFTKIIKFGRELTPEKAARYIIRFGTL